MSLTRRNFSAALAAAAGPARPWYERTVRWGQTNITEKDPVRYDVDWWRKQWRKTSIQGVILNAGGIVAYYPSRFPRHHRAAFLGERDLFGELMKAARAEGLTALARMDSNRASEDLYRAEPGWFARKKDGEVYRAEDKYITCINGPYYQEYLPEILKEIIQRDRPDGFGDNSWAGLGRESICYCENCARDFGRALPAAADWDDPVYRQWVRWSYGRRLALWDLNNQVTQGAGGKDCLWIGMISGSFGAQSRSFRDSRALAKRSPFLLVDHQSRGDGSAFHDNTDAGRLLGNAAGRRVVMPESMAMYHSGGGYFRLAAAPAVEARQWMEAGIAGGLAPWWHHIGAYQEDRRAYQTAGPVMSWHKANERYLFDREAVAPVGVLWSQTNYDYYGRREAEGLVEAPWRGFRLALRRARIPYQPVHVEDLERMAGGLTTLILPNVGALSDGQAEQIRRFVAGGGSLVATGYSSLYDEEGVARKDYALADVLGVHRVGPEIKPAGRIQHSYLRLNPERRGLVDGPVTGQEPKSGERRHAVLAGFDDTDLLPYGGLLEELRVEPGRRVLATYVPPFPQYPPETSYMRVERTQVPAVVVGEYGKGRVVFLPADVDRRYFQEMAPDHGRLLANVARWAAGALPLKVEGPGLVSCDLYRQAGRRILHLLNETGAVYGKNVTDEVVPVGPLRVTVEGAWKTVKLLVAGKTVEYRGGVEVERLGEHEVLVFEG